MSSNPFAELSASVSPAIMQTYVVIMFLLVAGGTLFDMWHKKSARFFFQDWRKSKARETRPLGGGAMTGIAIQTAVVDVLTSAEFCRVPRRIAHLLSFYGFVIYVVTTAIMVFGYTTPGAGTPVILPVLWNIGVLMVMGGGYWFWFFLRVDVAYEGYSPFRLVRADLFVVSLLVSVTFGLLWEIFQAIGAGALTTVFLGLYIIATTVLFGSVPWSKFSHMFYKPAAAYQKRVQEASGSSSLPPPAEARRGEV